MKQLLVTDLINTSNILLYNLDNDINSFRDLVIINKTLNK